MYLIIAHIVNIDQPEFPIYIIHVGHSICLFPEWVNEDKVKVGLCNKSGR